MLGAVTSLTNKPPFAAPLPFNSMMLSPNWIVVESTVVVVPWTNKLPLIVTDEPVPLPDTIIASFNEEVYVSILPNLSVWPLFVIATEADNATTLAPLAENCV